MDLRTEPLAPELWPALDDLFDTSGAVSRCWCMYWRVGPVYRHRAPERNRAAFLDIVEEGPPPGLVAMDDRLAIGWVQVTPRSDLEAMARKRTIARVDDLDVWVISCFYVRKGYRRRGVATALIEAAIDFATERGAAALEAYPVDADETASSSFTGYSSMFAALGFEEIERRTPARPIMRRML